MTKVEKSYEYAKGRPHNDKSTQQWARIRDPDKNLLGGFIRFWKDKGTMNAIFINDHKTNFNDACDYIIELESGRLRNNHRNSLRSAI
jgi:hypothetical protein